MARFNWIDIVKGIGILLVVLGHVGRGLVNSGIIEQDALYYQFDNLIYSFHMPLFFLVSGYLVYRQLEKHSLKRFVISKVDVILYPYVIWSLIQGVVELVMSQYTNRAELDLGVLNILHPHAQFWFLYWLFIFSLLIGLTIVLRRYQREVAASLMALGLISYLYPLGIAYFYNNLVYFVLGYLLASYYIQPQYHRVGTIAIVGLAVVGQLLANSRYDYSFDMDNYDLGSLALTIISMAAVVCIALYIESSDRWSRLERVLAYLGNLSLPIYLMHIILASGARIVLQRFLHIDDVYLHWFAGMAFGLGGAIVADNIFKRLGLYFLFRAKFSTMMNKTGVP